MIELFNDQVSEASYELALLRSQEGSYRRNDYDDWCYDDWGYLDYVELTA